MALLSSPADLIKSIPPVTRIFTLSTVIFSALHAWLSWESKEPIAYLVLVPGSSWFYPWTFLSSVLVETHILQLLASLLFVPPCLRYLERIWGTVETIKFIAFSVGLSNLLAFLINWVEFAVTKNADLFLYGMQYRGQMALQIALLVAFTQLIPEHQVQILGVLKARIKTLPMMYLTLSTVLCVVGFQAPWILIQFGWYFGWAYLRFYKKTTSEVGVTTYGDRSETFSLISWFPPFAHYPIGALGNFLFSLASRFHIIPNQSDVESGLYVQPGSARAEAERRRAMALKALDQHVANSSSSPPPQPSTSQVSAPKTSPSPPRVAENGKSPDDGDIADGGK